MIPDRMRVVVRAPNHLGDGVMALPALDALSKVAAQLQIHAPAWGPDLYRGLRANVVGTGSFDVGDVAVLFPPSLRVAWQARASPRRVGTATDFRRWLLTDVVEEHEHRRDTYAELARAVGGAPKGTPQWAFEGEDPTVPEGHIGLNPLSRSGDVVEWKGYTELARRLDRPVVFYAGPGERLPREAERYPQRLGLSLPAFARCLARCSLLVSSDSGGAHFARACGTPTFVIYGSTSPTRTGPAGAFSLEREVSCRPCYAKHCVQDFECLQHPVASVADRIREIVK